jgi:hypothetical protein
VILSATVLPSFFLENAGTHGFFHTDQGEIPRLSGDEELRDPATKVVTGYTWLRGHHQPPGTADCRTGSIAAFLWAQASTSPTITPSDSGEL